MQQKSSLKTLIVDKGLPIANLYLYLDIKCTHHFISK